MWKAMRAVSILMSRKQLLRPRYEHLVTVGPGQHVYEDDPCRQRVAVPEQYGTHGVSMSTTADMIIPWAWRVRRART